jgi:hypothetical protein
MDAVWKDFREAVAALPPSFDAASSSGWTVKEMLAHVAFWDETVQPFVDGMFRDRGWEPQESWHGGDPFDASAGWPAADVHNSREATWARRNSPTAVLERLDRAHERALALVEGLAPDEVADERYQEFIASNTFDHYREHLAELRSAGLA